VLSLFSVVDTSYSLLGTDTYDMNGILSRIVVVAFTSVSEQMYGLLTNLLHIHDVEIGPYDTKHIR